MNDAFGRIDENQTRRDSIEDIGKRRSVCLSQIDNFPDGDRTAHMCNDELHLATSFIVCDAISFMPENAALRISHVGLFEDSAGAPSRCRVWGRHCVGRDRL